MSDIPRSDSSWRRMVLPVSLILNVFLAALIGGHFLRKVVPGRGAETPLVRALAYAADNLPPSDADIFKEVMRRNATHYAERVQQLLKARAELERQITAEPFNQQTARAAYSTWQADLNAFVRDFGDTLIEALARISPEGRRKIVALRHSDQANPRTDPSSKPSP
jgi:uncharacterized membrane protein